MTDGRATTDAQAAQRPSPGDEPVGRESSVAGPHEASAAPADAPPRERKRFRWPTCSLRSCIVTVILLATLPIAALMGVRIVDDVDEQRELMRQALERTAHTSARSVDREIVSSADALTILSYSETLQQGDIAQFELALRTRPVLRPSWSSAYLVTIEGRLLFDTADEASASRSLPIAELAAFRRILAGSDLAVSGLLHEPRNDRYLTTVQVPVRVAGSLRYVLGAWIDVEVWQSLIDRTAPPGGFTTIFDREHVLVARTKAPFSSIGQALPASAIAEMHGRLSGHHRTELLEGGQVYESWDTVPSSGWGVSAGLPAGPYDAAHRSAFLVALATACGSLLLGLALGMLAARSVTRPLRLLATGAASGRVGEVMVTEVASLRDALAAAQAQDQAVRERLQAKVDEFETLFDSSPIGIAFAQDPASCVVVHNAAMDQILGAPPSSAEGSVRVLHRGRPVPLAEMPLQRAAARGETTTAFEIEIIRPGLPSTFALVNAVPLRAADGQPRGAISAAVDITERKLAEARLISVDQRLRESQRLVDLAQEAGHVGFFHYLFATGVLSWTPGQAKLFGMEGVAGDATLDDWSRRVAREDRLRVERTMRRLLAERRQKETIEYRVALPDGSWRWLSSRVLVGYASDGRPLHMLGISVDMTDEIEAERERAALVEREQAARREAEAASRSKDEFLAMLGHELRNPLGAIAAAVTVLERSEPGGDTAVQARAIIARQTRRLADMMDDLLDVARVISGKVVLARQPVALAELVRRTVETLRLTEATARHTLELELDEVWIDADSTRIEQVVTNLLTNALKYTPSGGRIRVLVDRHDDRARLRVCDDGNGIPAALLPRIFDLFVQGERSLDRRNGGLGIGLTLARRLVELHDGSIAVDSDESGTCFTILLPTARAGDTAPEPAAPQPAKSALQIVVIEDNDDVLHALRASLELDGDEVAAETDGARGLELLLDRQPDAAVVDIGLPGLDGYEVARRSRAAGYRGRMIAVSGYGQARDVDEALAAGFDAHIVKPVDVRRLQELLHA